MPNRPTLVLAPRGRDANVICSILAQAGLEARAQRDLVELIANLSHASAAILVEEALVHESRTALARWLANQPPWSDFPFVLLTLRPERNGRGLSDNVELLGNVTVLERPLAATTLCSAVRAAVRARVRQRESEQYLLQLKDLTATLERKVEERTRELTEANTRLLGEIAERERTEAALRQAQKMEAVGQLTGGIAHDFNNLLMAITGNLELLNRRMQDESLLRYGRNAMQAAQRGARLVNQLLAFSRKQQLIPQRVEVTELLSGIGDLLARAVGPSVRMDVLHQPGLWAAHADPTQLELMILNLAINARDAMPSGGIFTIELANFESAGDSELGPGSYVSINVADTGVGMPPEVLARAFDPFFTTKPAGKGTGLGLSQVYGFARQSGGTVRIESKLGVGTVVRIFLPRSEATASSPDPVQSEKNEPVAPATILLVDDDLDVLCSAQAMLEELGYRVISTSGGSEALRSIEQEKVEAAIVDLMMPGMSGIELAAAIREVKPRMPILFCSGYPDPEMPAPALDSEDFIKKPYQAREIARKLKRILTAKR